MTANVIDIMPFVAMPKPGQAETYYKVTLLVELKQKPVFALGSSIEVELEKSLVEKATKPKKGKK